MLNEPTIKVEYDPKFRDIQITLLSGFKVKIGKAELDPLIEALLNYKLKRSKTQTILKDAVKTPLKKGPKLTALRNR